MTFMQWFYIIFTAIGCNLIVIALGKMFYLPAPIGIGAGILIGVIALKMGGL